ncbi:MAG TPA: SDR family NAD(P)-dependent oxidoreductase [Marmoricola sp.]|nr:SDR family NAD(P)-dependent oxidoreductase [Marmoricola sp.]
MSVAVVTGTSSGMGMHAAVELARSGHHVVATMRDTSKAERLRAAAEEAGVSMEVRTLDVTDHATVSDVVAGIGADHGSIDVLINNAGQGMVGSAEQLSLQQIQDQLDVNYLGPVAMTKAVLPIMRKAGGGRILTVTSVGGVVGQPFADAYCGAKFAVEGFMQSLASVAETFGVWVSVIEPAAVASEFVANVERPHAPGVYEALLGNYVARTAGAFANAQSAIDAGVAIAAAANAPEYRFRWQTSEAATQFAGVSLGDLDGERVLGFTRPWIAGTA